MDTLTGKFDRLIDVNSIIGENIRKMVEISMGGYGREKGQGREQVEGNGLELEKVKGKVNEQESQGESPGKTSYSSVLAFMPKKTIQKKTGTKTVPKQ